MPSEEYEIVYSYPASLEELKDLQFYEEMFFDLSNILRTIYEKKPGFTLICPGMEQKMRIFNEIKTVFFRHGWNYTG